MSFTKNHRVKIYYEVVGQGVPLVMHYGLGNSIEDYFDLGYVDALATNYQLILIDARGFGRSDRPVDPGDYTFDKRASDTIAVLNDLNVKYAIAWGNSMGAITVYSLMHHFPERFIAYCVGGNHPYGTSPEFISWLNDWLSNGIDNALEVFEKDGEVFPAGLRERYLQNDPEVMLAVYNQPSFDFSTSLSKISVPTLLYCGEKDPYLHGMECAAKLLSKGELRILKGLTHAQSYWQGVVASEEIKRFLAKHKL